MISDGDSKSYNAIKSLNYEVTKEECLNHVSKRMGTALRKVWKMKVDEIVFGGNGKGRRKKKLKNDVNIMQMQLDFFK